MDGEQAEQLAWRILGEVEEMMSGLGVSVLPDGGFDRVKARAYFEDAEYQALEDAIVGILLGATEVQPVLRAECLDGHDW